MASVKLNNINGASNLLLFSDVPNILSITDSNSGTKTVITLTLIGNLGSTVTGDSQYTLTILDETISNTTDPSKARNKRFFCGNANTTAAQMARALRACGSLQADFNIVSNGAVVTLTAKQIGSKLNDFNTPISTNIPTSYLQRSSTDGTASSSLWNATINNDVTIDGDYVTTLEKVFYVSGTSFNLSPLISSNIEYSSAKSVGMNLSYIGSNGTYNTLSTVNGNYATYGYVANNSSPYLTLAQPQILLNTNVDFGRYIYYNTLPFSVASTSTSATVTWSAKNSANTTLASGSLNVTGTNIIKDAVLTIPQTAFTDSYSVELTLSNKTAKFSVAKPLRMTEGCTRIFYLNCYGGTAVCDLSGAETFGINNDVETYNANDYGYYTDPSFNRERVYDNEARNTFTVKSHLVTKNCICTANELARTRVAWVVKDGVKRHIIIENVSINEDQSYAGIFELTLSYRYANREC